MGIEVCCSDVFSAALPLPSVGFWVPGLPAWWDCCGHRKLDVAVDSERRLRIGSKPKASLHPRRGAGGACVSGLDWNALSPWAQEWEVLLSSMAMSSFRRGVLFPQSCLQCDIFSLIFVL